MPLSTVVLTAHGSRDPRAGATVRAIARSVAPALPEFDVTCAYLDFEAPSLGEALRASESESIVVPMLLTPAYHARVDIPSVVDHARAAGARVGVRPALGGADAVSLLAAALDRRLGPTQYDAVVVAAAGSRDLGALSIVADIADDLAELRGVPCRPGFASGAGEPVADAVRAVRRDGARNVGLAQYFLAPGVLPDRAIEQALETGANDIAQPLADAPEVIELIRRRVDARVLAVSR